MTDFLLDFLTRLADVLVSPHAVLGVPFLLGKFGSSSKTTQNSTQSTTIDPQLKARQDAVWQQAQDAAQPYTPYTGQRFEGFNPDQTESFAMARDAATAGTGTLNNAIGGAQSLAGFNGQQVTPEMAQAFIAERADSVAAQQVGARTGAGGYESYMNPYTKEVIDTSLSDIERARQEAANATRSQAAVAGAFGGSRSGVAESLSNRDFGERAARTAAQLRSAGFDTALQYNAGDQARELQAGGMNQQASLTADLANQATQQQRNLFNAGQLQKGSEFNADLGLRGQEANQNAAQNAADLRLRATDQLGGFAGQQQDMGAMGADLVNRIGGQQQAFGQQGRDFDYQQFIEGQQRPYENVNFKQGILGQQHYGTTQTGQSTTKTKNSQGIGSALLGAATTVGGAVLAPGGLLNKGPQQVQPGPEMYNSYNPPAGIYG